MWLLDVWSCLIKKFEQIQGQIPKDLYDRLINKRKRVSDEDTSITENQIRKWCKVRNDDHFGSIMKGIEPLLRNKRRKIWLMWEDYEEVNMET